MLDKRLYHAIPPPAVTKADDMPTLLVSWWCTGFALTAILVRLAGRYVRTERLFKEDKIMALSIIPLLIRMGFVHVILIWGTNNAVTLGLSEINIHHRAIGSRLVLASRIFYAAFIWTAKFTVSEFLKRVIGSHWRKSYEIGLQVIRYFLAATFVAVVIATLAECQPFDHYWQVVPDPGPKCREGLAQLITMGTCDIVTDILLVVYPIPIIIASAMPVKRKISLTLLFMLSLGLVAITAYRVPAVIARGGAQQFRTLLASLEILAAAAVSNALVIGSFIRDRGAKKQKYKFGSQSGSTILSRSQTRDRQTTVKMHHWGSDADLVSDLGMGGLHRDLQAENPPVPRPAPVAMRDLAPPRESGVNPSWNFPSGKPSVSDSETSTATDPNLNPDHDPVSPSSTMIDRNSAVSSESPPSLPALRKNSFFDVGGMLDQAPARASLNQSRPTSIAHSADTAIHPPSTSSSQTPLQPYQDHTSRRYSRAQLADVSGFLSPRPEPQSDHSTPSVAGSHPPVSRRNFSRHGVSYKPPVPSKRSPANSGYSLAEDDEPVARRTSPRGGINHSIIEALASDPTDYRAQAKADVSKDDRHQGQRSGNNGRGGDLELSDPGGLLG